jgi:WD40 repeat protein
MIAERNSYDTGVKGANKIAFDPSGTLLAIALSDGTVKFWGVEEDSRNREIKTGDNNCQSVLFHRSAEYLVTSGNGTENLT